MADLSLLLEAEKRGILPFEKQSLLTEARSRGLVPALEAGIAPESATPPQKLGIFDMLSAPFEMGASLASKPRAEQVAFIAPTIEALGTAGGAIVGTGAGPFGPFVGAGAGYAGARELTRLMAGDKPPETLPQAAGRQAMTVLEGAAMEGTGRNVIAPAIHGLAKGIDKLKNVKMDEYLRALDNKGDDILAALRSLKAVITPGSAPTAGEIAAPVGSVPFSKMQASARGMPQTASLYAQMDAQTNAARLAHDARVQSKLAIDVGIVKAKIDAGLVNVSQRETGQVLLDVAKVEQRAFKSSVIQPAYTKAFKAAGEAKIDVSDVVAQAESILGRKLSSFAPETAPGTVRKLLSFKPVVPPTPPAAFIGKGAVSGRVLAPAPPAPKVLPPEATLQQLDDVRKAINADIFAAKAGTSTTDPTTLRNLYKVHDVIDEAISKSTSLSPDTKALYADALNKYRTGYVPRFKTGVNANLFKQTGLNEPKLNPDDVVKTYFQPKGEREAGQFVEMFGKNPDAMRVSRAGIEDLFRREVVDAAGNVSTEATAKFMKKYADPIRILDGAGMNLSTRFGVVANDAKRLVAINELAAASGNKLAPALPSGSNALAVEQNISKLTKGMTLRQLSEVSAVRDDLLRSGEYERLVKAGAGIPSDFGKIATQAGEEIGVGSGLLHRGVMIFNNVAKRLMAHMDVKIASEIARELTNPSLAAHSIEQALKLQMARQLPKIAPTVGRAITTGVGVNVLASQNQNAMNE